MICPLYSRRLCGGQFFCVNCKYLNDENFRIVLICRFFY